MVELIKLNTVSKNFGDKVILNSINLTINKGDFIICYGESGSGKSSLLNILSLLDTNFGGDYFFKGRKVFKLDKSLHTEMRKNEIGIVFQSFYLLEQLSVNQNIFLPNLYNKSKRKSDLIDTLIKELKIDKIIHQKANTLSGGEKQRVSLLRALYNDPSVILCDEPTGNLDEVNAEIVLNTLKYISKEGKAIVLVTHNKEHFKFATKIYKLSNGEIEDV